MARKMLALSIILIFIVGVVGLSFAQDVKGAVTKIDGKKVTVKDAKGNETTVEVKDVGGAKARDEVEINAGVLKITKKYPGY